MWFIGRVPQLLIFVADLNSIECDTGQVHHIEVLSLRNLGKALFLRDGVCFLYVWCSEKTADNTKYIEIIPWNSHCTSWNDSLKLSELCPFSGNCNIWTNIEDRTYHE